MAYEDDDREREDEHPEPAEPAKPAEPAEPARPYEREDRPRPGKPSVPQTVGMPQQAPGAGLAPQPTAPGAGPESAEAFQSTAASQPAPAFEQGAFQQPTFSFQQPPVPGVGPAPQQVGAPQPVGMPQVGTQQPTAPGAAPMPSPYGGMPNDPYGVGSASGFVPPAAPGMPGGPAAPVAPDTPAGGASNGSGKAVGALICGIAAILLSGTVLLGVIFGVVALVLAGRAVRAFGRDGKATAGKVCGIVGIVLSVLALALYVLFGVLFVTVLDEYDTDLRQLADEVEAEFDDDYASPIYDGSEEDAEEAFAVVERAFDLRGNDELMAMVAEEASEEFEDSMGQTLSSVGLSADEFASWLVESATFEIGSDDVFVYDDGTGVVFASVNCRTLYGFTGELYDGMNAYLESGGYDDPESVQVEKMAELARAALDDVPEQEAFVSVEVEKRDGVWVVDEGSLREAVENSFGL